MYVKCSHAFKVHITRLKSNTDFYPVFHLFIYFLFFRLFCQHIFGGDSARKQKKMTSQPLCAVLSPLIALWLSLLFQMSLNSRGERRRTSCLQL